jgi:hypothetical protein
MLQNKNWRLRPGLIHWYVFRIGTGTCKCCNDNLSSIKLENFLTSWEMVSFLRRTLLHCNILESTQQNNFKISPYLLLDNPGYPQGTRTYTARNVQKPFISNQGYTSS